MSTVRLLLHLAPNYCESWPGVMRTTAGQTIDFSVETPMAGDPATTGLDPVDKTALQRARALLQARLLRPRALTTVTYVIDEGVPCKPRVTFIVVRARLTSSARPRSAASRRSAGSRR